MEMADIERALDKLALTFRDLGITLPVQRQSDQRLTPEDQVVVLMFADGTPVTVTEHTPTFIEA